MQRLRMYAAAVLTSLTLTGIGLTGGSVPLRAESVIPAAIVNDVPIMPADIAARQQLLALLDPALDVRQTTARLIDDALIAGEAARRGVSVDPVREADYRQFLLQRLGGKLPGGIDPVRFDAFVRVQMQRHVLTDDPDARVDPADLQREARITLQRLMFVQKVFTDRAAAERGLQGGFEGERVVLRPVDLPSPSAENAARADAGSVFGPLPVGGGRFAVLRLLERQPAPENAAPDELRLTEERMLLRDAEVRAETLLQSLRAGAVIRVPHP